MSDIERAIQREAETNQAVKDIVEQLAQAAAPIWHWGDGYGGYVKELLRLAVEARGLEWEEPHRRNPEPANRKAISRYTREIVIARDGLLCSYCKVDLHPRDVTLDHKIAVANGGSDEPANLCVSCQSCNSSKGVRDHTEFVRRS